MTIVHVGIDLAKNVFAVQGVDEHFVIEDKNGQKVELFALKPNPHAADMLIACAPLDETNLVVCKVAHDLFNVPTTIARVRNLLLRAIQSGEVGELTHDQKTALHGVRVSLERSLRAAEKTRETE